VGYNSSQQPVTISTILSGTSNTNYSVYSKKPTPLHQSIHFVVVKDCFAVVKGCLDDAAMGCFAAVIMVYNCLIYELLLVMEQMMSS
nr:hypothetical protein [Tanacetum cinerariifolium]